MGEEYSEKTSKNADSPLRKYLLVFVLSFANLLNYTDRFILIGLLSNVKQFYSLSNTSSGFSHSVLLVSYTIFSILFGILGDHYSKKWLISSGLFIWSFFSLLCSFVPKNHAWLFYVSRSMVGIGEAGLTTLAFPMVGELFESGPKRTTVLSIYLVALPIGSGIGIIIGPIIADHYDWRYSLAITPIFSFLCGLLTAILIKNEKSPKQDAQEKMRSQTLLDQSDEKNETTKNKNKKKKTKLNYKAAVEMMVKDLRVVLSKRSFISCTLAYSASSFATGGITAWAIVYMQLVARLKLSGGENFDKIAEVSKTSVGLLFGGSMLVCGILGVFCGGEFSRMLRKKFLDAEPIFCAFCNIFSAVPLFIAIVIAGYTEKVAWAMFILTAFVMCFTWTPNSDLLFQIIESEHRALATAVQILCMHLLGDAISPTIVGFISDKIRINDTVREHYRSLCVSLLVIPFVLVFSGILYMFSANNYIKDRETYVNNEKNRKIIKNEIISEN